MFDIGWQELFIVGLLALIVVGPKDLPRVIRTVSGVLRKVKGMAREFQSGLDDVVRESELSDMRKQLEEQTEGMKDDFADEMDPTGDLTGEFDFTEEQAALEKSVRDDDSPAEHYEPEIPEPETFVESSEPETIAETPPAVDDTKVDDTKKDG